MYKASDIPIEDNPDDIRNFYRIDKELGSGSFGLVRKAVKKSTGEEFAIKIIDKKNLSTEDIASLETEVEILTQIDHPNVVKLFEIYEDDDFFYMVLELMTGGELFERIVEKDHYSEKEAADTLRPIVDALGYCHSMGVAHRDLKPENLLYSSKDAGAIIKISDFGLARFINDEVMTTQCGTPGYVAPEIIVGKGYNEAIDIWSVGVILYILLCGFPPFYDENNDKLFDIIKTGKYDFPSPYWDHISDQAKSLIKRLLVVDPKKRMTIDQILKDPWITENTFDKNIPDLRERIIEFNAKKKFKKIGHVLRAAIKLKKMMNIFD